MELRANAQFTLCVAGRLLECGGRPEAAAPLNGTTLGDFICNC